jgi:hypothetical protein
MNPRERHEKHVETAEALNKKGALGPCPVCGESKRFVDGNFTSVIYTAPETLPHGPSILCVPVICRNCGLVTPHSLEVLGVSIPDVKAGLRLSTQLLPTPSGRIE